MQWQEEPRDARDRNGGGQLDGVRPLLAGHRLGDHAIRRNADAYFKSGTSLRTVQRGPQWIDGLGWTGWRGGKDGMDEAAYAVSRLPTLAGKERTDAEDLAISLVRDGRTYFAHVLGRARCTRALPLLREIAADPSRPPPCRLQAAQGLILMDAPAGRTTAIDILRDATIDRSIREDAIRLLTDYPNAEAKRALEQA